MDHGESYPDYLRPLLLQNRNVACPGEKTWFVFQNTIEGSTFNARNGQRIQVNDLKQTKQKTCRKVCPSKGSIAPPPLRPK